VLVSRLCVELSPSAWCGAAIYLNSPSCREQIGTGLCYRQLKVDMLSCKARNKNGSKGQHGNKGQSKNPGVSKPSGLRGIGTSGRFASPLLRTGMDLFK